MLHTSGATATECRRPRPIGDLSHHEMGVRSSPSSIHAVILQRVNANGDPTMKALKTAIAGLALISLTIPAGADVITDWNQAAIDVMKAVNVAGNPWTRTLAIMHVAMSDAVNAVHNRYTRFTPDIPPTQNAAAEAAAASAAREILMRQYPGQKARIDAAFSATLENVPDTPARAAGIALGEKVATAVYTERQDDATNVPDTYRPMTQPGVWVPTTPPLFPQYATAKPWGMT